MKQKKASDKGSAWRLKSKNRVILEDNMSNGVTGTSGRYSELLKNRIKERNSKSRYSFLTQSSIFPSPRVPSSYHVFGRLKEALGGKNQSNDEVHE